MEFSTIVLAAAEAPGMLFVAAMGMITVMIGLACIIFLCMLMSKLFARFGSGEENAPVPAVPAAAAPVPAPAPVSTEIPNRGELIAAVSAAIAEELGTDISAIRVRSFQRVGAAAAPAADPARGELVAAISAAVAEELGTDVSRVRIHSLKKIG